jgi:hypothetical protein
MRHFVCGVMPLAGTLIALPALAQGPADLIPGIARISAMKGKVLVRHGGGKPIPATLNTPLASGDIITTESGAHADVDLDSAQTFRLAGSGKVRMEKSEYESYQIALDKGGIVYRVAGPSAAVAAVDTPSVSAAPSREGVYRIGLMGGGESEIKAVKGEILVYASTGSVWVNEGQRLRARGPATDPEFRILERSRVWMRLAEVLGNIQFAVGVVSSVTSAASAPGNAVAKKSVAGNSGQSKGTEATPHPSHTSTAPAKSDPAHGEGSGSHASQPAAEAPKSAAPAPSPAPSPVSSSSAKGK